MYAVMMISEPGAEAIICDTFHDPQVAARSAQQNNECNKRYGYQARYRVVPMKMPAKAGAQAWQKREQERFDTGIYVPVLWSEEDWYQPYAQTHYAHVSKDDPTKIAYTMDDAKGAADLQQQMKVGKYLQKYFVSCISPAQIREWAMKHAVAYEPEAVLQLAYTADDIETVYLNGPNSCMSHPRGDYSSPCHPVRVYSGPDLAVAYLGSLSDEDSEITARALVWPDKKIYSRIYGDEHRLSALLRSNGYVIDCETNDEGVRHTFKGARLTLIRSDSGNSVVCPYVDNYDTVSLKGEYLVIGTSGTEEFCAQQTNGWGEGSNMDDCPCCGERFYADEGYAVDDETWCESCYDNNSFNCGICDTRCSGDEHTISRLGWRGREEEISCCSDCHRDCSHCGYCRTTRPNHELGEDQAGYCICQTCINTEGLVEQPDGTFAAPEDDEETEDAPEVAAVVSPVVEVLPENPMTLLNDVGKAAAFAEMYAGAPYMVAVWLNRPGQSVFDTQPGPFGMPPLAPTAAQRVQLITDDGAF